MNRKFALIDQSVKGAGGHHLEYALRVLDAAATNGFEPVLGAGDKFKGGKTLSYASYAIFHHSFWENLHREGNVAKLMKRYVTFRQSRRENALEKKLRRKYKKNYSQVGLDRERAREVPHLRHELMEVLASDLSILPSKRLSLIRHRTISDFIARHVYAGKRFVSLYRRMPHRLRRIVFLGRRVRRAGFRILMNMLKRFVKIVILIIAAPFAALLLPFITGKAHRPIFAEDLQKFIKRANLKEGDIAFIPTLGETEMLGLADLCEKNALARSIEWRLLFRRDLFAGRAIHHSQQNDLVPVRRFRLALEETKRKISGTNISFYTDTDLLTEQYNSPNIFHFETLPIPVGAGFLPAPGPAPDEAVVAGYLGDARDEKGYPLLASALDMIYQSHVATGKLTLLAQSNFNLEGGEPGSVAAKLALMALPPLGRELPEGPFDSDEYAALFNRADMLLIPYDPDAYASRSSGVFAEALAAGRPTLVTRGSWMATILEPYKQAYLEKIEGILPAENQFKPNESGRQLTNRRSMSQPTMGKIGQITSLAHRSHLLTRLDFPRIDPDMHVTTTCKFYDIYDRLIETASQTAWLSQKSLRVLIPIPEKTARAAISIEPLDGVAKAVPDQTIVRAVNLPTGIPNSFGGAIVDPTSEQVARGMREIVDNYASYRAMSLELAKDWGPYCSAETLVNGTLAPGASPPSPEGAAEALVDRFFDDWIKTVWSASPLKAPGARS